METRSDNVRALLYAIGVHVLCIAVAFSGLFWWQSTITVQAAGEPIEAVFVETGSLQPVAPPPRPQPPRPRAEQPTPPTPPAPTPTESADDLVEQQRIDRLAQLKADEEAREQEEKRKRAEQILLEEEQKRREEEERKREEQQRIEREKAEEEAREKAEREAQEKAEREATEKAAQEAAAQAAAAQAGNRGQDDSLLGKYGAAITRAVHGQWRVADNAPPTVCTLRIIQIPGGEILDASVVNPCNADDAMRTSLERAARNAQPLPYAGFESVFRRQLVIKFCHPQDHPECMQ